MSASLVRKSLQLFESDKRTKNRIDVPENNRLTKSILKKGKKEKITLLKKDKKLTVDEIRKRLRESDSILESNIKKLQKLHQGANISSETASVLLSRAVKNRPINYDDQKPEEPEESIFTEEDIKNIEENYHKD